MRTVRTVLVLSLFILPWLGYAQIDTIKTDSIQYKGAEGVSSAELIDQLMVVMPGLGSSSWDMLHEQSVKPYLMPPRRKGMNGDPASYVLANALEFYVNFDENFKVNLSPDFIRINTRERTVINGMAALITEGTVSAAILPYDAVRLPSSIYATDRFKIKNYLHLFRPESGQIQKVFETRKALIRGNPVIVELAVTEAFSGLEDVREWEKPPRRGDLIEPVLVTGYQEDKELFEISSAYGAGWAQDGYLLITYDDFSRLAQNGYVLVPQEKYQR
jgi:hypothetical protein